MSCGHGMSRNPYISTEIHRSYDWVFSRCSHDVAHKGVAYLYVRANRRHSPEVAHRRGGSVVAGEATRLGRGGQGPPLPLPVLPAHRPRGTRGTEPRPDLR